jgi:Tol biopolymer transport system component
MRVVYSVLALFAVAALMTVSGATASARQFRLFSISVTGEGRADLGGSGGSIDAAALSPDRTTIAFEREGEWWLMRSDGSGQRRLYAPPSGAAVDGGVAWSPDSTKLAIEVSSGCHPSAPVNVCYEQDWSVIVGVDGTVTSGAGAGVSWAPDGKWLVSDEAFISSDNVEVWYEFGISNANNPRASWPRKIRRPRLPADVCLGLPAWSPDGRWIAASTVPCNRDEDFAFPERTYLFPVAGGKARAIPNVDPWRWSPLVWSPDGARLALQRHRALVLARGNGTRQRTIVRRLALYSSIVGWSANGRWFAFRSGQRLFITRGDGTAMRRVADNVGAAVWSPDSRSLAYTDGASGQIFVSRLGAGPTRVTNEPPNSQPSVLGWSADSTRLFYADTESPGRAALHLETASDKGDHVSVSVKSARSAATRAQR